MHHPLEEPVLIHLAVAVDVHLAGQGQPVHSRVEGADAVGQGLGQHRDHPPREVGGVPPVVALLVQVGEWPDVVGDIGDGHDQPEPVPGPLGEDGVIEVLGIRPVDGHQGRGPQVLAIADGLGRNRLGDLFPLAQHLLGPVVGNAVLAQDKLHLHLRGEMLADDLDDPPCRLPLLGGLVDDLHRDQLARARTALLPRGDQDILGEAALVGDQEGDPVLLVQAPHNAVLAPLHHAGDGPLGAAPLVVAGQAGDHPVAVEDLPHLLGREEQVLLVLVVGNQEAEAVGVGLHPAPHQIHALGQPEKVAAGPDQLTVALHGVEPAGQGRAVLLLVELEPIGNELLADRGVGLVAQELQDVLPARYGTLVALRFPLLVGVFV